MAEEERIRLFLGSYIDLNPVKADFDYPIKFISTEKLHITWKFFGETQCQYVSKILNNIENALAEVNNISINFNRFELWPDARFPSLLVLAGDDLTGEATKLFNTFNKNKFKPHITVARFKLKQKPAQLIKLPVDMIFEEKQIDIKEISLINSTLSPKGSVYKTIKTFSIRP